MTGAGSARPRAPAFWRFYVLGPVVKASGFTVLLTMMTGISAPSALFVSFLPICLFCR
jgi:hypothetical protein